MTTIHKSIWCKLGLHKWSKTAYEEFVDSHACLAFKCLRCEKLNPVDKIKSMPKKLKFEIQVGRNFELIKSQNIEITNSMKQEVELLRAICEELKLVNKFYVKVDQELESKKAQKQTKIEVEPKSSIIRSQQDETTTF